MSTTGLVLYDYWRSSACYRVRIALNLKGLACALKPVHLLKDGGEQHADAYRELNPQEVVPTLVDGQRVVRQSLAIIEYLDETCPQEPLLPPVPRDRAHVRGLAQLVACEIHPLNNLRVLKYLVRDLKVSEEVKNTWYLHWVKVGLDAFERELAQLPASTYCFGETPTLADCCLVPQIFNAKRVNASFEGLPRTMAAFEACMALPAFQKAQPSNCPDNEP